LADVEADVDAGTGGDSRTAPPDCLFCRIAAGRVPAEIVRTGRRVLAFRDLNPQAPTHVLVIPRDHHANVVELADRDAAALAELVQVGAEIAQESDDGGFRLVFNTGPRSGQSVFHVHGHVLAGRSMAWPPG
jgi:histidine triad (HIT) family protein